MVLGFLVYLLKSAVEMPTISYGTSIGTSTTSLAFDRTKIIVNTSPTVSANNKGAIELHTNVGG